MAKKQREKENKKKRAITPSEAIRAFEQAFRSGSPDAVESLLRDMLNVQVAVVKDKHEAEQELAAGKRLKTIPVPYGVFLGKVRSILGKNCRKRDDEEPEIRVYCLKPNPRGDTTCTDRVHFRRNLPAASIPLAPESVAAFVRTFSPNRILGLPEDSWIRFGRRFSVSSPRLSVSGGSWDLFFSARQMRGEPRE